jgi:hypothetical protein
LALVDFEFQISSSIREKADNDSSIRLDGSCSRPRQFIAATSEALDVSFPHGGKRSVECPESPKKEWRETG